MSVTRQRPSTSTKVVKYNFVNSVQLKKSGKENAQKGEQRKFTSITSMYLPCGKFESV